MSGTVFSIFLPRGNVQSQVRDKELELTEGVAELRVGLGDLLLRVEEGELLRDQLVQEVLSR